MKISRAALAFTAFVLGGATAEIADWVATPARETPSTQVPSEASTRIGQVQFFPRSSDSPAPSFYRVGSDLFCTDVVLSGVGHTLDNRVYIASFIKKDADTLDGKTFAPTCTLSSASHGVSDD